MGGGVEQAIPGDLQDIQQGGPDSQAKEPDDCQTDAQGAAAPAIASHPVGASHLCHASSRPYAGFPQHEHPLYKRQRDSVCMQHA